MLKSKYVLSKVIIYKKFRFRYWKKKVKAYFIRLKAGLFLLLSVGFGFSLRSDPVFSRGPDPRQFQPDPQACTKSATLTTINAQPTALFQFLFIGHRAKISRRRRWLRIHDFRVAQFQQVALIFYYSGFTLLVLKLPDHANCWILWLCLFVHSKTVV